MRESTKTAKRGPTNSLGEPWKGETWSCALCGDTGPDRDDVRHSECDQHPAGAHRVKFHPPEHDAAMSLRWRQ